MAAIDWHFVPGDDVELTFRFPALDAEGVAFDLTGRTFALTVADSWQTSAVPAPTPIGSVLAGVVSGLDVTFTLPAADSAVALGAGKNHYWVTQTLAGAETTPFEGRVVRAQAGGGSRSLVTVSLDPVVKILSVAPVGAAGISGDASAIAAAVEVHVADTTPHPVYDDMASLTLLFENALI